MYDFHSARTTEYWIECQLDILDPNPANREFIQSVCTIGRTFENDDRTYKPLCDVLRSVGYEIVSDKEEQKKLINGRKPHRKPRTKIQARQEA